MKTMLKAAMLTAGLFVASAGALVAQDAPAVPDFAAPAAAPAAPAAQSTELAANPDQSQPAATKKSSTGFWAVVTGSGGLGVILWLCLFGAGVASIYFVFDCSILFKADKMIPKSLVDKVSAAMAEGDVLKALKACESEPGPLANILSSAFSHVEEGFDVIQEAIQAAADIETERVMQRINWISVCGNLGPSLGLLGTVEGMILTFNKLAETQPSASELAGSIGQALWTTAFGLIISIPAVAAFYALRNKANRIILRMTAVTMELLNGLRNVEVAPEEGAAEEMPA